MQLGLGSWVGAARKAAQGRPCRLRRRGGKEDLGGVEAKTSGQKRECNEARGKHSINWCQLLRKGHDGTQVQLRSSLIINSDLRAHPRPDCAVIRLSSL